MPPKESITAEISRILMLPLVLEMDMVLSFPVGGDDYMQVKQQAQFNDNAKVKKVKKKYALNLEVRVLDFSRARVPVVRATVRTDARLDVGCPTSISRQKIGPSSVRAGASVSVRIFVGSVLTVRRVPAPVISVRD
jgi:hypothetical protein